MVTRYDGYWSFRSFAVTVVPSPLWYRFAIVPIWCRTRCTLLETSRASSEGTTEK